MEVGRKGETVYKEKAGRDFWKRAAALLLAAALAVQGIFLWDIQPVGAEELSESELYAKSACLMDGDSGRVLYGKEAETPLPMASTTKIMTCILALEQGSLEQTVTASARAAGQPKVHLGVREGQQFLMEDLLYALMAGILQGRGGDDCRGGGWIGGSVWRGG